MLASVLHPDPRVPGRHSPRLIRRDAFARPRAGWFAFACAGVLLLTSASEAGAALRRWTGQGDGSSWNNAANWEGSALPGVADDVLLDHAFVGGTYTVQLPGGSTTVSIHRLTIQPGNAVTITLRLPATNVANPGLKAGDGAAGTDDIVLASGGVMINSSSASFGNGIEANSVANGTVRIDNGGRYLHNTLRAASGMAPLLSTAAGTELGVFEYDVPGTALFNITASGRTYGSLTLTRTAGAAPYGVLGASDWRVRGNLRLNTGVTLNSTMTAALRLEGNLSNDGLQISLPTSHTVIFQGQGLQSLNGSSGITISGTGTIQQGSTLALDNIQLFVNGTLNVNGKLRLDLPSPPNGLGTFVYAPGTSELELLSPTAPVSVTSSNNRFWPTTNGPAAMYVRGAGLSLEVARTATQILSVEAPILGAQLLTVSGTLEIKPGFSLSASPIYTSTGTLRYAMGASPGVEWLMGTTAGAGVPQNVVIDASGESVTLPPAGRVVPGKLTVQDGTLAYDAGAGIVSVRGAADITGTVSTFGRTLTLDGTGTQLLSGFGLPNLPLRIAKTAGSVQLATDVRLSGLTFDGGAGDILDLDGRTLSIDGAIGGSNPNGALRGGPNSGLFIGPNALLTPLRFTPGGGLLRRFVVAGPVAGVAVTLGSDFSVADSLVLVSGRVVTGPFGIDLGPAASAAVDQGWVTGRVGHEIPDGAGTPLLYPIGDVTEYAPLTLTFGNVSVPGTVWATTAAGDHPQIGAGSGIDPAHSVNRTWHLDAEGLEFDTYAARVEYPNADLDLGSDPQRIGVARYDSAAWYPTTPGVRTTNSTEALRTTGFGDLAAGTLPTHTLTATSGAHGIVSVSPQLPEYLHGEIARLTAVPDAAYHLMAWQGDAGGSVNPLDVVMDANKSINATFAINHYYLTVSIEGQGDVSRNPDASTYVHGQSVQLTAVPDDNWHLKGWSGAVVSTANPVNLVMTTNAAVTATFERDTFKVTSTHVPEGTITRSPNRVYYSYGDTATLSAVPAIGYHFVTWGGDASGGVSPYPVIVDQAKTVTATFAFNSYTLAVPIVGSGSVARAPDLAQYPHGTAVSLTATPDPDYHFVGWSGDTTASTNPLSVVMTSDRTYTATFAVDTRTLTITVNGEGVVLRDPDLPEYPVGTVVTLTAAPDPGQIFTGWSGDTTSLANPLSIAMTANRSITVTFQPNVPKYWTGLGDAANWNDAANWIRNTVPIPAEEVILDNQYVANDYTVTLPAGATSVSIRRLTLRPGPSHAITLSLPVTNTANPGLAVGDSLAGTDDVIIGAGGVIENFSGASAGNGIQVTTLANGRVKIENGGRYLHSSLRSVAGVAPMLSTATGTETGIFEYDVPGTANWNLSLSGRTYGSLVLTRNDGPGTYSAIGASTGRVRGTLRLNTGVTFAPSMTGTLELDGNVINNGVTMTLPGSQPVLFAGTPQTLSGSSGIVLGGTGTIPLGSTLQLTSTPFTVNGTLLVNGALRLLDGAAPGGSGSYVYSSTTGTLEFGATSAPYTIGAGGYWPSGNDPAIVRVLGAGASLNVSRTVAHTMRVEAPLAGAGYITVANGGMLELAANGTVTGGPLYTYGSTLRYTAARTVGEEWGPGLSLGSGVPYHVEIAPPTGAVLQQNSTRAVAGNLLLTSGSYELDQFGGDLRLGGNLSGAGTFNTNGHALLLVGTSTQTLAAPGPLTLDYLRLSKSGGEVKLLTDVTLRGTSSPALEFNGGLGDNLSFNDRTLTLLGAVGGSNPSGTFRGSGTSNLVVSGTGDMGSLSFAVGTQAIDHLTIDISGGASIVRLGTPVTVVGVLSLQHGTISTGAYTLSMLANTSVTRNAGYVTGRLEKVLTPGAAVTASFEVGNNGYAPVTVTFPQLSGNGSVTASSTAGDHPNLGTAALDPQQSANRYWTLASSGVTFDSCTATFGFSAADLDAGANPLLFEARRYAGGSWTHPTVGARTATSTTASGITALGDFAVARPLIYTLNLSTTPGGTATKNPDLPSYDAGTSVTLTATNQPGYHFTGWSGDASGTTSPLVVVMNSDKTIAANFDLNGPKKWVGSTAGGDGVTWTSPLNWTDGAMPLSSEQVILDNTYVAGTYSLTLPSGSTQLNQLTITPNVGTTITLALPASNTANPGLRIGDSTAGTDDIILNPGAVLKNSSGAASGSGVALLSAANGKMRIANGGRYVHNTTLSPTNVVAALITTSGTEMGEFEYDVPGAASFALDVAGRTYGSLTLTRSAGAATYTVAGASALTVRGNLKTNANVTLTSTMTAALNLAGDLTVNGAALSIPAGQAVNFNGNAIQTAASASGITFGGTSTVAASATLAVSAPTFNNSGTMTITGALQLNQGGNPAGTGTYSYDAVTGSLIFNNTSGQVSVASTSKYWPATASPVNVIVQGAGGVGMSQGVTRTVPGLFKIGASFQRGNVITCTGTVQMSSGGSFQSNGPVYSGTPTLIYAASMTPGLEWVAGTNVGVGIPYHVVVNAGTLTLPNSDRDVMGNLSVSTGATLSLNSSANLIAHGNFTTDGTITTNGRSVQFTGNTVQNFGGASTPSLDFVVINKSGGSVVLTNDIAITGTSSVGLAFNGGAGDVLNLNGHVLTLAGTVGGSDASAKFAGSATSSLVFNANGAIGTLRFASGSQSIKHVTFGGSAPTLTLATPLAVNGTLALGAARVTNGANTISLVGFGAITRGTGFVAGALNKPIATGNGVSANYEIGTGSTYAPVSVTFGNVSAAGSLSVTPVAGDHPQIASSGLDNDRSVNRYWTLTNSGIAFDSYSSTLNFDSGDLDAGTDPQTLLARRYSGSVWNAAAVGTLTSTSAQLTGVTGFGDLILGAQAHFTVTLSAVGNGSASRNPNQATYTYGSTVVLTGTPTAGNSFVSWGGDTSTTTNPLTIVVTRNRTLTATFTWALTTTVVGGGTIARSPNQTAYNPGTVVTLTANPSNGYLFSAWSGDTVSTNNPIQITMNGNRSVTATFVLKTYTISLATLGNGTAAKSPDQATYTHGSVVTLTGTPNAGNAFVSWSGDTSTATNPLTIVVTKNRTLTANFTWTLTTSVVGGGTVSKNPNQTAYNPGTPVTLTATPNTGWNFTGWTGDTTTSTNPLSIVMTRNRSLTANFALNTYTVSLTTVGNGSAAKSPNQATYTYGSSVTLTGTPNPGNSFVTWAGDTTTTTNPLTIIVTRNRSLTATFTYTLTTSVNGGGTVGVSPNQTAFNPGTPVTLTATPSTGWNFTGWTGDTTTSTNPLSLVMTRNRNLTANFALNTYTVTVSATGDGSAARSPSQPSYTYGSTVTLTGTANGSNVFLAWSGDTATSTNPLTIVVTKNRTLVANFTYSVTAGVSGSGSVALNPNQTTFAPGTPLTLTATPSTGWHFTNWTGDTTAAANPLSITVTRNRALTANFVINSYTLTTSTTGLGSVSKNPNQASYTHGTPVTLTATPLIGYNFTGWTGDTTTSTNPLSIVMTRDRNLVANFAINQYSLSLSSSGNGSAAASPSQATYPHGTSVTITATSGIGWDFTSWSGDTTASTNPLTIVMTRNRTLVANFVVSTYTLSITTSGSGSVAKNPNQASYDHGTVVTLTATPSSGWHFVGWSGDSATTNNPIQLVMNANRSLTAAFALDTFTLDVSVAGGGSVSKNPNLPSYPYGTVVTLTANAQPGWGFQGWSGDTTAVTNPLTLTLVANRSLTATFIADVENYSVAVATVGSGGVSRNPNLGSYPNGTQVVLTATPTAGNSFLGWAGDTTAGTNPLTLVVYHDWNLTATFTVKLDVQVVGSGSVARAPNAPAYAVGTPVALTATPGANYHFTAWSGDTSATTNPLNLVMTRNRALTATFAIDTHVLTTGVIGNGSVTPSPSLPQYAHGAVVSLTATSGTGWHFGSWSGDASGTANPTSVTMNGDRSVTATFALDVHSLDVSISGTGTVVTNPSGSAFDYGTMVKLTAVPGAGWRFEGWSGDLSGTANPDSVVMTTDHAVGALFVPDVYNVNVTVTGKGSVVATPSQPSYPNGSNVSLNAVPSAGWTFMGWGGDVTGHNNPVNVTVTHDMLAVAVFADRTPPTAQVVTPNGGGGQTFTSGDTTSVRWIATDQDGVQSVDLWLIRPGYSDSVTAIVLGIPNSGTYLWTVPTKSAVEAYVRVVARDTTGNTKSDQSDGPFQILRGNLAAGSPGAMELSLMPPVPNPAVGRLKLSFTLPEAANVNLIVLDIQGREIASLVDGWQSPGRHDLVWDRRGARGAVSPGVYFARLSVSGEERVRRLVLAN